MMPILNEVLNYRDMVGLVKPTIHVDEFNSKMGDDADIIVVSFFVRGEQAARDLVSWFEKGYDWVLDADRSPGELRPGRYLVYVEMRRRSQVGDKLETMLEDLETLTGINPRAWRFHYDGGYHDFSREAFDSRVPLTPRDYRKKQDGDLNEMRQAAGIDTHDIYDRDRLTRSLQSAAGIL